MHLPIDIAAARLFLRLLFGLILLSAGTGKLAHPRQFLQSIQDYHLLPAKLELRLSVSIILSFVIPIAELFSGLGLFSGFWLFPSVVLAIGLFAIFSGAIAINLLRGRHDLSCHCGGVIGDHLISWWLVGRNGLLMVCLLVLLITPPDLFTVASFVRSPSLLNASFVSTIVPVAILVGVVVAVIALCNAARVLWRS